MPDSGSPGWYPNPSGAPNSVRYWDGQTWTETRQLDAPAARLHPRAHLRRPHHPSTTARPCGLQQVPWSSLRSSSDSLCSATAPRMTPSTDAQAPWPIG
ncbi:MULTISPECIES: DUF2510 domain-containing protein [unclassified Rhodococcus (in: high G+C Gram-positive bacteria)]|uniref:DUF2510 domain-containing protein n=1 Tax=unclassified Rhodococcus (in: high G+C Gram-positive bacteria) TaxID=192944 RepID=UPI00163A1625|nr:DUF2510 domain-containing protein [Rhodococcus sp. 3A]MBC2898355.1 DUF2510 domain-containing protein [Rhodococcus sp. 4CII]